jgi:iron complex outermembrane receptor protein
MINIDGSVISKLTLAILVALPGFVIGAENNNTEANAEEEVEKISIVGSRRLGVSPADVTSPVSIIGVEQLQTQGSGDMINIMRAVVPSFNVSAHTLSGTSSLIRPPNMRGLGADHVLVLVNGKRRHRAANIPNFSGGVNDGTQGVDISNIPAIALKNVQVLRDGAAAQYGADAIAGVMNFVANDDPESRSLEVKLGQHYKGDGESVQIAGTYGMHVGDGGSLNLSFDYTNSNRTDRAQQSDGNQAFADAGYDIRDPAIFWGAPEINDNLTLFANLVLPISETADFYANASYNERENISGFFFRAPDRGGVFAIGDERIVFDTTDDGSGNCPNLTVPSLDDPAAVSADIAAIDSLRSNPNCFSFLEDFPNGTAPFFLGENEDYAGTFGVSGDLTDSDVTYDVSFTFGRNKVTYTTFENFNPTFGPDSPNSLVAGSRIQEEQTFNAQMVFPVEVGFESEVNIATGIEWHREAYEQVAGQEEAFAVGPFTETAQGTQGISVGTLGFGSFSPATSFSDDRDNIAAYVDVEADITESWTLGAALRYEDFSDLGDDTNYKISSLYRVSDTFNLRGTFSTGFHAPTPGQLNFAQSTVAFDANGVLTTSSTLPTSIAAQLPIFADSAKELTPETSENYSLGFSWEAGGYGLTVDYYRIDVDDRITLTSSTSIGDSDRTVLFDQGFTNASQFASVNFFTNDFDTTTEGFEIIGQMPLEITDNGTSELSLTFSHNTTEVTRQGPNLSELRLRQLEEQLPENRGSISFTHSEGDLSLVVRANYFGELTEYYLSTTRVTELDSQITMDLEVSYDISDKVILSIGGQNIFDSFPTGAVSATSFGNTYPVSSPDGFGGGYYYAKVKYNF